MTRKKKIMPTKLTVLNRSIKSNTSNKVAGIIASENYAREKLKILSPQANPMYS